MPSQAAAAAPDITVLDTEPGRLGVYSWKQVCVVTWPAQGTEDLVERFRKANDRMVSTHTRIAYVHLLAPNTPLPTPGARTQLSKAMREHEELYTVSSIVLGGGGFWASALRSVVVGLQLVGATKLTINFHYDLPTAANWVATGHVQRGGTEFDPQQLLAVLQQIADWSGLHFKDPPSPRP